MGMPSTADMERDWLEGHTFTGGPVRRFEIVTEQDAIVLQGSRDEASDQVLKGKVILDLKESISGKVRLRLSRKIRHRQRVLSAGDPFSTSASLVEFVYNTSDIDSISLDSGNGKLPSGLHEYPFSFTIPADSPASLEGPVYTYVIYRLKCTVERGMFAKDLVAKKHVRVHRTFSSDSLAFQYLVSTESYWDGKCAYVIQTPRKGIIYGTKIPLEYKINPFKKGVKPVRVKCQLEQKILVNASDFAVGAHRLQKREVSKKVCEDTTYLDNDLELDEEGWYNFKNSLDLPKELTKIVQTYKEPTLPDIEVKHIVHYQIGLINPEGHVSEIQGELGVILFFTRQMHVQDNSVNGQPETIDADESLDIPPDYQHSQLDQLYDEVNLSGYTTPLPLSGTGTPRVMSAGNLQALLEDGEEDQESADEYDEAEHESHANTLRNRLDEIVNPVSNPSIRSSASQSVTRSPGSRSPLPMPFRNRSFHGMLPHSPLSHSSTVPAGAQNHSSHQQSERPEPHRANSSTGSYSPPEHHSLVGSVPLTRQNSPIHIEALSRVPSYETALRTPPPIEPLHAPYDGIHLPSYEDASRQNSIDATSGSLHTGTDIPSSGAPLKSSSNPRRSGVLSLLQRK